MNAQFDIAISHDAIWSINGEEADDDVARFLDENRFYEVFSWCPHCRAGVSSSPFNDQAEGNDVWHYDRYYISHRCKSCGFWQFSGYEGGNKCMDSQSAVNVSSVAAKFAPELPQGCSRELAQYLRRHPEHWHEMKPKDLELLVADIFRANYKDSEVMHVGKPHDRGVDVVFIETDGERWLIQAKRRERPEKTEGFETLQRILGTMVLEDARHGIIVSTSDKFSYWADQAAKDAQERGFTVKFIDKGKLERMVQPLIPETPWSEIFSLPDLKFISEDIRSRFYQGDSRAQLKLSI